MVLPRSSALNSPTRLSVTCDCNTAQRLELRTLDVWLNQPGTSIAISAKRTIASRYWKSDSLFYVICRQCGFVYTNPLPCSVAAHSDTAFNDRIQKYIDEGYGERKQKAYTRALRKFSRYQKTKKLLEIGCNVGAFLYRARELGWDPTGIEPADVCAAYARDTYQLDAVTAFLEGAGLPENAFDVVYSNAVFDTSAVAECGHGSS